MKLLLKEKVEGKKLINNLKKQKLRMIKKKYM